MNNRDRPEAPSKVSITYSLTRWDLWRTQVHWLLRNRTLATFLIVGLTLAVIPGLRQPDVQARPLLFKTFYVIFFGVFVIGCGCVSALILLGVMVLVRKYRGVLGEHTIEVTDAGLVEHTDVNDTLHRWAGFHKVVRTRAYLYLYVTDALVHAVPLRCFASEDQVRQFVREIERHTLDHQQEPGPEQ